MGVLLGPPIIEGNKVEVLLNGDQIFPAMLKAIRGAQKTITFETYIYWSETIGKEFADALAERARAGVKVHVMLDFIGSMKMDDARCSAARRRRPAAALPQAGLVEAGAPEQPHPPQAPDRRRPVGFTGGVGIADQWRGNAQDEEALARHPFPRRRPGRRPDAGRVHRQLDQGHRRRARRRGSTSRRWQAAGDMPAQMFSSSPTGGSESMHLMYLMAITAARQLDRPVELVFRARRTDLQAPCRRRQTRRQGAHHHARQEIDSDVVRAASRERWGDCSRPASRSPNTSRPCTT
jgi:cardiolipin synthase